MPFFNFMLYCAEFFSLPLFSILAGRLGSHNNQLHYQMHVFACMPVKFANYLT
uniref:Uncharacterized protein n=1 Tax=Arundo donax TaxID=35708 RepID=A0A0A9CCM7_ARUDO